MNKQFHSVKDRHHPKVLLVGAATLPLLIGGVVTDVRATEPCDDFGECKVLIEINASDGDIGFHWLADADDLKSTGIRDPNGELVYTNRAYGPLRDQQLTETFGESAEPLCWEDPEADPEDLEDIVTLEDFIERWAAGTYTFRGGAEDTETLSGETVLTYMLPAAPQELNFDGSKISWEYGTDLGNCTPEGEQYPDGVALLEEDDVDAYEVVLEPDVGDGNPIGSLKFTVRVSKDTNMLTVPQEYLATLPQDTPVKVEVGAIGGEDNATFTEEDGFCVNEVEGCEQEES